MIKFVATVKEKNKRVAIAIATYPDGATTCIARAQDFLSDAMGIPRHELVYDDEHTKTKPKTKGTLSLL